MTGRFKIVPHTAELAFEASGATRAELLESAAAALLSLYEPDPPPRPSEVRTIALAGAATEDLLIGLLNELVYLVGAKRWVPAELRVAREETDAIEARLNGSPLGGGQLAREIKAATFGGLHVARSRDGWSATVIVDV